MTTRFKYGMVGGGPDSMVGPLHRKAIAMDGSAVLAAGVFSGTYAKTIATGSSLGLPEDRCYHDYSEMAVSEAARPDGIDFVVVVTPNNTHYPICRAFLEAGIHVVCDKPLALTAEECIGLKRLSEEKHLLFMVTYTYMGNVTAKHAREFIAAGGIGEIHTVMAEYPQSWLSRPGDIGGKQGAWRQDPAIGGRTNALGDIGTHIEYLAAFMTGLKIHSLLAKMERAVPGRVLDDNDFVMVRYDNGATGMYWASQAAIGHTNGLRIRIYGSTGSVMWNQENSDVLTVASIDGTVTDIRRGTAAIAPKAAKYSRLPAGHPEGWLEALANLYTSYTSCLHAVKDGTFTPDRIEYPTAEDGISGLRFLEACLESNGSGNTWVNF